MQVALNDNRYIHYKHPTNGVITLCGEPLEDGYVAECLRDYASCVECKQYKKKLIERRIIGNLLP